MNKTNLIGLEMAREEDMLLAGLRRYWGVAQLDDPSDAELLSSQSPDNLRTPEELVIKRYGEYFLPAFRDMQHDIVHGMKNHAKWATPALYLTPEHLCLLAFKSLMPSAYPRRDEGVAVVGNRIKLLTIAETVADHAWNLLHYMRAKDEHEEIWDFRSRLIKSWSAKKQRRFVNEVIGMTKMDPRAKKAFGIKIIQCITDAVTEEQIEAGEYFARRFVHYDGKRRTTYVEINPRLVNEMIEDHQLRQWLRPKWGPMVCAPNQWVSDEHGHWGGGYLLPGMQMKFVRPATPGHDNYGKTEPGLVAVNAINRLQSTPYAVNEEVLEVMKITFGANLGLGDCPESAQDELKLQQYEGDQKDEEGNYTSEFKQHLKDREATHDAWAKAWADRLRMVQRLDLARDITKYPAYWLPITMDFRGRCYTATEMLSPQGSDFDKSLCQFAEAKPYTEAGRYWMKIQIANLFGEDKISFEDRAAWFDKHEAELRAVAQDPITHKWWSDDGDDKKKWQLLASILDYFREDGMNRVAVQMDGSCNGIQHWSAIGRDMIGAKATNLLPGDKPEDLYTEVANFGTRLLAESRENDWHKAWREQGISRKCAKRPCMTYPYGVTLRGCVDSLKKDGHCDWAGDEKATAAQYIGRILMEEAIPGVVSASYQFMAWAKDIAKQANEGGTFVEWVTPLGTLVRHNYYVEDKFRLNVESHTVRVWVEMANPTDARLSTKEMVSGIAPNFVHSLDASHMLATINAMWANGLQHFSMIHDSFGCHASDVDEMQRHIREQFVRMYTLFDPATLMADRMADKTGLEPVLPPTHGSLDINLVLQAPYFFA